MLQKDEKTQKNMEKRPPVVVVMGHIDHGKSTLLDYIRKTNTTDKEAGGITQHLSAYEAEMEVSGEKRKITFMDTPGHEAFCSIRERSASVADIAILVIAADDSVKPQTVEAIECIKKDAVPFIVAINKIDRNGADVNKVKQDLAEHEIFVEGWGGTIPVVPISAKTGEGVPELLEMIILQSDIEELHGNKDVAAEGFVIESNLNPKQGISATLIIKDGSLKIGSFVAAVGAYAPVRSIEVSSGKRLNEASFSSPIKIIGWNSQPFVGSQFKTFDNKDDAIIFSSQDFVKKTNGNKKVPNGGVSLELIVKADTTGSLEAVEHELDKLDNNKTITQIISKGVGEITESDIKTANIKKCLILGFNTNPDRSAKSLALRENIEIKTFNIIYELVDFVKEKMKEIAPIETIETVTGTAKILKTFSKNKDKQVIGGKMEKGELKSGNTIKILRRESVIGQGKIKELQIQKIKMNEIKEDQEFGTMIESKIEIMPGDVLQATQMIKK